VSTPIGNCIGIDLVLISSIINIDGRELCADLILLYMFEFDVILVIDWLAVYHANVDYFSKEFLFRSIGELELRFF